MSLEAIATACGQSKAPGTKTKLRLIPVDELNGWPKTKAELAIAAGNTPAAGDTKVLGEEFTYTADTGKGYWREYDILLNTGNVLDELEGDLGGQGYKSSIPFTLVGTDAVQLEFADTVAAYSGCLIAMIETRSGNRRVLGEPDIPAVVREAKGQVGAKNGDINGFEYVLEAATGKTAPIYDSALNIKTTPN